MAAQGAGRLLLLFAPVIFGGGVLGTPPLLLALPSSRQLRIVVPREGELVLNRDRITVTLALRPSAAGVPPGRLCFTLAAPSAEPDTSCLAVSAVVASSASQPPLTLKLVLRLPGRGALLHAPRNGDALAPLLQDQEHRYVLRAAWLAADGGAGAGRGGGEGGGAAGGGGSSSTAGVAFWRARHSPASLGSRPGLLWHPREADPQWGAAPPRPTAPQGEAGDASEPEECGLCSSFFQHEMGSVLLPPPPPLRQLLARRQQQPPRAHHTAAHGGEDAGPGCAHGGGGGGSCGTAASPAGAANLTAAAAPSAPADEAFCTLLYSDDYLPGILALANSLRLLAEARSSRRAGRRRRRRHAARPLLVITIRGSLSDTVVARLRAVPGLEQLEVRPPPQPPGGSCPHLGVGVWAKMALFGDEVRRRFRRVVFLDADYIALLPPPPPPPPPPPSLPPRSSHPGQGGEDGEDGGENGDGGGRLDDGGGEDDGLESLFESLPQHVAFAAAVAEPAHYGTGELCGGLLVVTPSAALSELAAAVLRQAQHENGLRFYTGEQDFLAVLARRITAAAAGGGAGSGRNELGVALLPHSFGCVAEFMGSVYQDAWRVCHVLHYQSCNARPVADGAAATAARTWKPWQDLSELRGRRVCRQWPDAEHAKAHALWHQMLSASG